MTAWKSWSYKQPLVKHFAVEWHKRRRNAFRKNAVKKKGGIPKRHFALQTCGPSQLVLSMPLHARCPDYAYKLVEAQSILRAVALFGIQVIKKAISHMRFLRCVHRIKVSVYVFSTNTVHAMYVNETRNCNGSRLKMHLLCI